MKVRFENLRQGDEFIGARGVLCTITSVYWSREGVQITGHRDATGTVLANNFSDIRRHDFEIEVTNR